MIGANRQLHLDLVTDDVVFGAAMEGANGDDAGIKRSNRPRNDRLQRDNDLRGNEDRVDTHVRIGAVRANAMNENVHTVGTGRHDIERHLDASGRDIGRDMEGNGIVRLGEAGIEAVIHHGMGAANALLGRLANQDQCA